MKLPDLIVHEEKVSHCKGFPLRVRITFNGCTLVTGKLFTEAMLSWKSCIIQYFKDEEVAANAMLPAIEKCPGCGSSLPMGPKQ